MDLTSLSYTLTPTQVIVKCNHYNKINIHFTLPTITQLSVFIYSTNDVDF